MVLPPRHHLEHVAKREVLVKRYSSTCTDECLAPSNLLSSSSDPYAFCSKEYFDGYQNCLNCYATLPYMSSDTSFFTQMINSFNSIVDSCSSLGKPVSNPLTLPSLPTAGSTGSGTKPTGNTPAPITPTIGNLPTGTNPANPASTNQSVSGGDTTNTTSSGPPIGVIVGGAIGGVAVIAGIVIAIFFLKRRNRGSHSSAGASLIPDEPRITPFNYPVTQNAGAPPPPMQQYNQAGPYSNQLDAASSYSHLPQPQQQYGLQPGPSMKQRPGLGVGGSMYDNHTSSYAPSSHAPSSYAPDTSYQQAPPPSSYAPSTYVPDSETSYPQGLSSGPFSSAGSIHESQAFSPTVSDHSALPFVPPVPPVPSPQYPTKQTYTQPQEPAAPQFDCPPAYDDEPSTQPGTSNQAASSSAAPSAQLSAAEMEVISQRVATLINAGGGLPADARKKG